MVKKDKDERRLERQQDADLRRFLRSRTASRLGGLLEYQRSMRAVLRRLNATSIQAARAAANEHATVTNATRGSLDRLAGTRVPGSRGR